MTLYVSVLEFVLPVRTSDLNLGCTSRLCQPFMSFFIFKLLKSEKRLSVILPLERSRWGTPRTLLRSFDNKSILGFLLIYQ